MPQFFCDYMVLQRSVKIPIWGFDNPGSTIQVAFANKTYQTITGPDGKWIVKMNAMEADGKSYSLTVKSTKNNTDTIKTISQILIGDVWLCSGQSNMERKMDQVKDLYPTEIANSRNLNIRYFRVGYQPCITGPLTDIDPGSYTIWKYPTPINVLNFGAVAYFFGNELYTKYQIPIGLVNVSHGGSNIDSWMSPEALAPFKLSADSVGLDPNGPGKPLVTDFFRVPASLYNGEIAPLTSMAIKGVIWYQGENDVSRPYEYRYYLQSLIKDWRYQFHQGNFPFLVVQLANLGTATTSVQTASRYGEMWESQNKALELPKTAVTVTNDIGEANNIHPSDKLDVGKRLALAAQKIAYGRSDDFAFSGPTFSKQTIDGSVVTLTFKNIGQGLINKGGTALKQFTIGKMTGATTYAFYNATATIINDSTITVSSPSVTTPIGVRYAWANNPLGANLYNKDGLPASSFRTDYLVTPYQPLTEYNADLVPNYIPFTSGNLAIVRVGKGNTQLSNKTVPLYLDEYSLNGDSINTINIPSTTVRENLRLVALPKTSTGSTSYNLEGISTLSQNGKYLSLFGYDQATNSTSTGTVKRVIARVDSLGRIDTKTTITFSTSGAVPSSAISTDSGEGFYVNGSGVNGTGILYALNENSTATLISNTPNSVKSLNFFNNKLYCSTGSNQISVIQPLTTTALTTPISIDLSVGVFNNQIALFDTDGDGEPNLIYVADEGSNSANASLRKFQLSGASWIEKGNVKVSDLTEGLKSFTGKVNGNNIELYLVTWGNLTGNVSSKLLKIVDNNASGSTINSSDNIPTVLATAPENTFFRSVTFTPGSQITSAFNSSLPVTLLSFSGKNFNNYINLNWSTASETNNSHFSILRSINGISFSNIGSVNGANNSNKLNHYSFNDYNPKSGNNYYKIEQIDFDGNTTIYGPLVINNDFFKDLFSIYATKENVRVALNIKDQDFLQFSISDLNGKLLKQKFFSTGEGSKVFDLPVLLETGIYILTVKGSQQSRSQKFIVK